MWALSPAQTNRTDPPRVRVTREGEKKLSLSRTVRVAATGANVMPPLLDCARVQASEGEIIEALQQVFGSYTETPVF